MIRHLADFATPLHAAVHREPFSWTEEEEKAFAALKLLLTRAPMVQPPDWNREFHVFVDASDIAIGSVFKNTRKTGSGRFITLADAYRRRNGIIRQPNGKL
jgi:hypothetical protein